MSLERDDIGAAGTDPRLVAMKQVAPPAGEARDDFAIFSGLAERPGPGPAFPAGRRPLDWLAHPYEPTRVALALPGLYAPTLQGFWERGELELPSAPDLSSGLRPLSPDPAKNHKR